MKHLYGSLQNRIAEVAVIGQPAPTVGLGATQLLYSDRHAGTITWVSPSGKTLRWRADEATRTDSLGLSDVQRYSYHPREGRVEDDVIVRLNRKGQWVSGARHFQIGARDEHYDFGF
jgi:hypothetical protein